jgi:hypothetical protein
MSLLSGLTNLVGSVIPTGGGGGGGFTGGSASANSDTGDIFVQPVIPDYPFTNFPTTSSVSWGGSNYMLPGFNQALQLQAMGASSAAVQQSLIAQQEQASSIGLTGNNKTLLIIGAIAAIVILKRR